MVAERGRVGVVGVAHLEAEHARADEVDPFDDLREVVVVGEVVGGGDRLEGGGVFAERVGEDDTTERVALLIGTMRVELCFPYARHWQGQQPTCQDAGQETSLQFQRKKEGK